MYHHPPLRQLGLLAAFCIVSVSNGQKFNSSYILHNTSALEVYVKHSVAEAEFTAVVEKLKVINKKMSKDFARMYANAEEIKMSSGQGGTYIYCTINGIYNRIHYNKKGHWENTLRYYGEWDLPKEVRHLVKSKYYDFSILGVTEVILQDKVAYFIFVDGKSMLINLKVFDGYVEELKTFNKS